jgi:hypothetical protein
MAGEHNEALLAVHEKLKRLIQVAHFDVFAPGVNTHKARGVEHFHAEHEHVLHTFTGKFLALGGGEMRETPLKIGHRACFMFSIEAIPDGAKEPGRAKIEIDGKPVHAHRGHPQKQVQRAVNEIISRLGHWEGLSGVEHHLSLGDSAGPAHRQIGGCFGVSGGYPPIRLICLFP